MAFTQSDVDSLKKAIASGVKRVQFADGRMVIYRDTPELMTALGAAQAEIAAGQAGSTSVSYPSYSRD